MAIPASHLAGRTAGPASRAVQCTGAGPLQGRLQRRAERFGKSARDPHLGTSVPACAAQQRLRDVGAQALAHAHARFQFERLELEDAIAPVRLGVDPAHQRAAAQDRQRKVTVAALAGRGVAFEPVVEAEQFERAPAVPDDRVEGDSSVVTLALKSAAAARCASSR